MKVSSRPDAESMEQINPRGPDTHLGIISTISDWKPVLTVQSVVHGLLFLLLDPNPDDPLNKEAAQVLQANR